MIDEISIRDLGVIHEAQLALGPGFTAVTGETGAGKTMVVTALGLVLGARADSGVVRSGEGRASVEARWVVPDPGVVADRVRDAGGDLDPLGNGESELILGRSVAREGRARAIVGGRSAPVSVLAELGEHLVVVHGQSEQIRLRSASAQQSALDRFGGAEIARALEAYRASFQRWRALRDEFEALRSERDRRAEEAELLRAALAEIEAVAPRTGEDEELAARAERLSNLEDLRGVASTALDLVSDQSGDGSDALAAVDAARREIERGSRFDSELTPISDALAAVSYALTDVAASIARYVDSLDADSGSELEAVQQRRAELASLARRHGPTLDDAIRLLDDGGSRLLELDGDDERLVSLEAGTAEEEERARSLAAQLGALRRAAAATLAERVGEELEALAMGGSQLVVEVSEREQLTASGGDDVEFLLRPYAGAQPRALARGASGGELSRLMLAIEVVIAAADPVPTFVFDEVDAGVGGASAIELGRRLAKLARTSQVIVVTHLAQVAAFATNHLAVVKDSDGEVTASSVRTLDGEDRVAEMARLLSGLSDSSSGLDHARELLDTARSLEPS